ncbi:hypothetical protein KP78_35040 [Jeotgalibacillus soli]|uniref:LysM domain-containing protein n=1 Tax=Jeotgalibacillus soli TaxID=889306 RepID=A0A0C2R2R8_9BACL|nr:SafA/ExsA family spore coat assembly protein [Jeotgalibacillus soli]KIL44540.1 hypothetical protein KP78_35040 [Jeotgalibacillus soli]
MKIHIVQKGDSLWTIAKKYNVSFEELKAVNTQLSNPDMIMPGMKIKVPSEGKGNKGVMVKETTISHPFKEHKPSVMPPVAYPEYILPKMQPAPQVPQSQPVPQPMPQIIMPHFQPQPAPQPIMMQPEVDIYQTYNLHLLQAQPQPQPALTPPPPPAPPMPEAPVKGVEEPPVLPMMEEGPSVQYLQEGMMPMMDPSCIPVTPVMPGAGWGPFPFPAAPASMGPGMYAPQVQGAQYMPMPAHYDESPEHHAYQHPTAYPQQPNAMGIPPKKSCGCGGQQQYMQPVPYVKPQPFHANPEMAHHMHAMDSSDMEHAYMQPMYGTGMDHGYMSHSYGQPGMGLGQGYTPMYGQPGMGLGQGYTPMYGQPGTGPGQGYMPMYGQPGMGPGYMQQPFGQMPYMVPRLDEDGLE